MLYEPGVFQSHLFSTVAMCGGGGNGGTKRCENRKRGVFFFIERGWEAESGERKSREKSDIKA